MKVYKTTEMQKRFAEYLVFGGPDGVVNKTEAANWLGTMKKEQGQKDQNLLIQDTHHWLLNIQMN